MRKVLTKEKIREIQDMYTVGMWMHDNSIFIYQEKKISLLIFVNIII